MERKTQDRQLTRSASPQDLRRITAAVVRAFAVDGWDRHELPMLTQSAATAQGVDLSAADLETVVAALARELPRPSL